MCARILAGVRGDPSGLKVAKVSGAPRTAFAPRYATVATGCLSNTRLSSMSPLEDQAAARHGAFGLAELVGVDHRDAKAARLDTASRPRERRRENDPIREPQRVGRRRF